MIKKNRYSIILGDVIGSSGATGVQKILNSAVAASNHKLSEGIVAPFEITRGDEIALVTTPSADWFRCILTFNEMALGLKMRWVTIVGEISEGLESQSSAEMIGPGFIAADSAMKKIKKARLFFTFQSESSYDDQISGIINFYITMLNRLTPFQHKVLCHYQRLQTQTAVAEKLDKSQQQIQKTLQSIQWRSYVLMENAIYSMLDSLRIGDPK